jgi:hypothetical protein
MIATSPHKLAPRSTPCVFIGYPLDHRGYHCYNIATGCVITSRHILFDEGVFPFCNIYRTATDTPSTTSPSCDDDDDTLHQPPTAQALPRRP